MKRLFFLFFALFSLSVCAEELKRDKFQEFWHRVDKNLSHRYYNLSVDTNYIVRPMGRWRFMARYNFSGSAIDAVGNISGQEFRTHATAKCKSTISFVGSYTGITLAMTFNPGALVGWYKDYEFNTNEYYNRMGVDIIYQRAKNFRGWSKTEDGTRSQLPKDMVSMRFFNFNYYYAFNHRRFSYPAAFCHSYIQKKSAGSFMLGASFNWEKLHISSHPESGDMMHRLRMANLAVGAGYGYNFALKHDWLLHLSALPTLVIYSYTKAWSDEDENIMRYQFPEFILTGRLALVHNFGRYFAGGTMVFNYSAIGDRDRLRIHNNKWRARAFVGFRF